MINARDSPTTASAGYPNSFSAARFHDVIMPLLSTITIASLGAAAVAGDGLTDAKPSCGMLLSTLPILCGGRPRDPAPTAVATSSGRSTERSTSSAWMPSSTCFRPLAWCSNLSPPLRNPHRGADAAAGRPRPAPRGGTVLALPQPQRIPERLQQPARARQADSSNDPRAGGKTDVADDVLTTLVTTTLTTVARPNTATTARKRL